VADRPGGDGERPRRPGGAKPPGGGSGSRGGPSGGRGFAGGRGGAPGGRAGAGGAGGAGYRGASGSGSRGGPTHGGPGRPGGWDRSGPGGPRRGFGFGGGGDDGARHGSDTRGGDARGRDSRGDQHGDSRGGDSRGGDPRGQDPRGQDPRGGEGRPFGPRRSGPPGGRPFDRGGASGGFRDRSGPRPPFRGIRPDAARPPRDDRPDEAGTGGGSRERPWDRPATPWPGGQRGGAERQHRAEPPPFENRNDRGFAGRPPFRPGSGRPPFDRSGPPDRRPTGPRRAPSGDRSGGDRSWREPSFRPPDAYRPGVAPSDLLAEDEELVAGRRPVEEAFVARRPARRLLVVPQRRQALERLVLHATSLRIPVVEVEGGTLTAVAGFDGHQGIALVVEPRTWAGIDDILARAVERGEPPFVLVLDSLEDPQNVGTLLRSAEAAGVHGVLFPTHRQAPLTPAAIKASAGAVEHLLLCPVDDLPGALSDLRIRGLRVAAAEADAPMTAAQADLRGPLAIVVGSEGQGLSPVVRRRADVSVRIPMRGAIGSLNAAVAGSILLFAAVAQRDPGGEGADRPRPATFDEIAAASSRLDSSTDSSPDTSSDAAAAWPPGVDEPVTDLAEAPEGIALAGDAAESDDPSTPARAAPKRGRKPALASATTAVPAATSARLTPGPKRSRKPAPTTAAQKRSRAKAAAAAATATAAGDATAAEAETAAGAADEPVESAPTSEAPRKPAKAARRSKTAPVADQDPVADDLLPGGPGDE